ncbi:MAG: UDP-2,3-diacylglucosamine diphosphatase, partial [Thiobacillus sp.]
MSLISNQGAGRTFFVADLHLTDERPVATGRFFRFLQEEATGSDALYILGDLFEAWVGDDHDEQVAHDTAQQLRVLVDAGTPVYFMHGNRDFMLAERYAALSGMTLLADPTRIDLYGTPTLLMHGDTLCIDDTAYQSFRRRARHPLTLALLRRLPYSLRRRLARQARAGSESAKAGKAAAIMDVNTDEVKRVLHGHQVGRLIHG